MSLTARVAAAIVALVAVTSLLSWGVANRLVFRPLIEEVLDAWVAEVAFVGERLDHGGHVDHLASALDLHIEPWEGPIPQHWRERERKGRTVWIPPGPKDLLVVETAQGRVAVSRTLDLQRPGRRLPLVLALTAGGVVLLAVVIARRGVRPLGTATDAMARMADRLAGLLRAEKQLLAGISHELRTPITRLTLEIELLRDAGVDPARLDRMSGDLRQLDDLVGEALELSRLELGHRPLERSPTSLRALAEDAVRTTPVAGHPVTVSGEGPVLQIDARLVRRALVNLIANAAKHTPAGTPIEVAVDGASVEVRDRGPGVAPEDLPRLFDPFFRTESGSRAADGSGLGLMIVRQVADAHGGTVTARDLGPGLGVRLSLPPP